MADIAGSTLVGLVPVLVAGSLLGAAFYGSLWWTVRRGLPSSRPTAWFVGGMVLRTGIALAAIYLVGGDHWERLATCLAGFVLARSLVFRLTGPAVAGLDGRTR